MIGTPLMQNPLAGGAMIRPQENQLQGDALVEQIQMRMQQRDVKTPAFMKYAGDVFETQGYPTKTMQEYENLFPSTNQRQPVSLLEAGSNANFNVSPPGMLNATPPSVPVSEQTPLPGLPPSNNFIDDTRDKTLPTLQFPEGTGPLQTVQGPKDTLNPPLLDGTKSLPVTVTGPEGIASTATAPETGIFNRVGQQLMGYDDQFSGINDRLNKIEEGIASLVQNRGQGLNMNTGGLGYFFNPFGGFYG